MDGTVVIQESLTTSMSKPKMLYSKGHAKADQYLMDLPEYHFGMLFISSIVRPETSE